MRAASIVRITAFVLFAALANPIRGATPLHQNAAPTASSGQNLCCTNVITYHNDAQRTGWNPTETTLTPANVTPSTFGLLTTVTLDDQVDAQPLVVTNQAINGQGTHTVAYVATEGNTVYAIDALSGAVLFSRNLGPPVPKPLGCNNNGPNVGIASTPVIDLTAGAIYVVAYTKGSSGPAYTIHNLSLASLADQVPPVVVTASHIVTSGATVKFNATYQRQRPALLEFNGNIYAGFGSFCDAAAGKSRGWVLGWMAGSLTPLPENELIDTQATAPASYFLSSVWMSGYGTSADEFGNLYFVTGNSNTVHTNPPPPNTYDGVTNIQESVLKVQGDLSKVLDLFTPNNVFTLDQNDRDFGSGGVMVLPDQPGPVPHLAVAAGKDGRGFILNRDNMGGFHNPDVPNNVMVGACWCGPSYFVGSDGIARVVTSGGLQARTWKVNTAQNPALIFEAHDPGIIPGGPQDFGFFTSVSSNGTVPNTAIIWEIGRPTTPPTYNITLYALNGTASGNSLTLVWSGAAGTWPNTGTANNPLTISGNANLVPTVANGMVYVASYRQLWIFGLTATSSGAPALRNSGQITQTPRTPAPPDPPGASYWGVVSNVNGARIVISLRGGETLHIDLNEAMKAGTAIVPEIGLNVEAHGTLDLHGVLQARTLWRAKGPASWGLDSPK